MIIVIHWIKREFHILFSDQFPDRRYSTITKRDILHYHGSFGPVHKPSSTFFDNLRFYDFVLHAKDVKDIFLNGEFTKNI